MIERIALAVVDKKDSLLLTAIGCPLDRQNEPGHYCINTKEGKCIDESTCIHFDAPSKKQMKVGSLFFPGIATVNIYCYHPDKPPKPSITKIIKGIFHK